MLLAESLSHFQLILLGLSMVVIAFLLRRTATLNARSRSRSAQPSPSRKTHETEKTGISRLEEMEVRLFDYEREVEGRVQTTLTLLDQLVEDADRESAKLQELLEEVEQTYKQNRARRVPDLIQHDDDSHSPERTSRSERFAFPTDDVALEKRRMIVYLADAGFEVSAIAHSVDCSVDDVQRILKHRRSNRNDAA